MPVAGLPPGDELRVGRTTVVLSPHLDDGVLSCGAALAACADAGSPATVLTVFTGEPEPPLSAEAVAFHRRCGLGDDAVASRVVEDERALQVVGATPIHLGIQDALYRRNAEGDHRYPRDEDMGHAVLDDEAELVTTIAALLVDSPAVRDADLLLAPLAIGNHIDHRITRAAAERAVAELRREPGTVWWYEDAPYVIYPFELRRPTGTAPIDPRIWRCTPRQWQTKLRAIECYASQQPILLGGDTTSLPKYLTAYAEQLGDGEPAERYWALP